jgi:hypothetical protein
MVTTIYSDPIFGKVGAPNTPAELAARTSGKNRGGKTLTILQDKFADKI